MDEQQLKELEKLKSLFRSLVVSNVTSMDAQSLAKDYRNEMGSYVPFRKFGYNDYVTFLRERFTDCFVFTGPPTNPTLTLIVTEKLKHIDKFVTKQRIPSSSKKRIKRYSIPESAIAKAPMPGNSRCNGNISAEPVSYNTRPYGGSYNRRENTQYPNTQRHSDQMSYHRKEITPEKTYHRTELTQDKMTYHRKEQTTDLMTYHRKEQTTDAMTYHRKEQTKDAMTSHRRDQTPDKMTYHKNEHTPDQMNCHRKELSTDKMTYHRKEEVSGKSVGSAFVERLNNNQQNKPVMVVEPFSESEDEIEPNVTSRRSSVKSEAGSGRTASSCGSTERSSLKCNLMELISEHPDGMWSNHLLTRYKEKFGRELKYGRFGFSSVMSMCRNMEDVFRVSRPQPMGDWLLSDPNGPPPAFIPEPKQLPQAIRPAHEHNDTDEALPGIDFDPGVFPEDCIHYLESIPMPSVADLETGMDVEMVVGEVFSPSHFWIQLLGEQHNQAMENIMDDMNKYYDRGEGATRVLQEGAVRVGHYCAARYEGDWHRSLIVQIVDYRTVKIRHIDYGTVDRVANEGLRPLRREWTKLRAQAIRARLAGLRPAGGARSWPHFAATRFLNLIQDKRLIGQICTVDYEESILGLYIVDTTKEEDIYVNDELVTVGHAEMQALALFDIAEPFLYPSFEALESGRTLNFADRAALVKSGICLDYVEEYTKEIPKAEPVAYRNPFGYIVSRNTACNVSKSGITCEETDNHVPSLTLPVSSSSDSSHFVDDSDEDHPSSPNPHLSQYFNINLDQSRPASHAAFTAPNFQSNEHSTSFNGLNTLPENFSSIENMSQPILGMPQFQQTMPNQPRSPAPYPYFWPGTLPSYLPAEANSNSSIFPYSHNNYYQSSQYRPEAQMPLVSQLSAAAPVFKPKNSTFELSSLDCEVLKKLIETDPEMAKRFLDDKVNKHVVETNH